MKKYLAEAIGTASLCLAVSLTLAKGGPIPTPVAAGLTLGLFVYLIGPVSGAHLNPAVTLGLLSIRKIKSHEALVYIFSQVIGALVAMVITHILVAPHSLVVADTIGVGFAEMLGTFFLGFAVATVVYGKVSNNHAGLVIGGALLLGITIAASVSNGVLNPAVALSIGSFSFAYLLSPIVGSILAMRLCRFFYQTTESVEMN